MKQVEITSKVVGRGESEGITSAIPSINLSGFALKSDLLTLEKKFSDFLNVPIIDGTINRWNELETFLAGISEDYNLLSLLNGKADKSYVDTNFVTIAGTEDVTGLHNFVNGLKIGGLPITKKQDDVVYLDANLVVRGGVTMYYQDGEVDLPSIIDEIGIAGYDGKKLGLVSFSSSQFSIDAKGNVTIKGCSTGLDTEELAEYLATNKYATQGWVEGKGYITSSALNGYATQSWVTNQKYITGITSAMVVSALGFTPYNSANFTKANIKSTLGISDWALASTKPSYNFSEIGTKPTTIAGYGITDAYTIQQADALYAKYLPLTGGTLTGALRIAKANGIASLNGYGANGGITMHFGYREDEYLRIDTCNSTGGYVNQTLQIDKNNRVSINFLNVGSGLNGYRKAEYRLGVYGTFGVTGTSTFKAMTTHSAGLTSTIGNFSGEVSMQSANINGGKITYDATNKYWKLEGDLLVTGGVSMYSDDSEFTPSTIMDGVVVDGTSIRKNPTTGALEVIGGSGATVKYPLSWSGFNQGSYDGSVAQSFYIPTKLSEFVNDKSFATTSDLSGYLPKSGGMIENTVADVLSLKRQNSSAGVYISFNNSTNGWLGGIGIGGSSTSIGIQPFVMLSSGTHQIYHSGNLTKLSQLTDDVVNGKYLPLSGGTINGEVILNYRLEKHSEIVLKNNRTLESSGWTVGVLSIRDANDSKMAALGLLGSAKTLSYLYLGHNSYYGNNLRVYSDKVTFGDNTIWHSGNDGAGSGLDADLLDGKHNGELTAAFVNAQVLTTDIDIPANLPGTGVYINNSGAEIGTCGTYDTVLTVGTAGRIFQFKGTKDSDIIQYRGASGNNGLRGWKTLLHSDNYSSYALPITGGTLEGALTVKGLIRSSVVNSASASWSQFLNYANASIGVGSISVAGVHPIIGWATAVGSYTTRFVIGATSDSETFGTMYIAVGTNNGGTSGRRLMLNSSGICQWEGDILSSGGITMYSDIRKKTKLQDVELSLSQIANAPLIEHYYNSDQNKTTHVGSIAQYWAGLNDWFCKLDAEGYYTMEIQNCALASAISIARHLEKYETKTDKTIRKMKQRIQELEEEVERLKKGA